MLVQIILLHGFDFCISIVRLNRYVIYTCVRVYVCMYECVVK